MARFFPMFLRLAGRIVVVVGGGDLAVRTVKALLACEAEVHVITPSPSPPLRQLRGAPNLTLITRRLEDGDLEDALLALAVDEDPAINLRTARQGLEWNVLVSVADELVLSDFIVPSFVHRGALTLALHTAKLDGVLATRIAADLEQALGPEYGDFIAVLERARERIAREIADPQLQRTLFDRVVWSDLREVLRREGVEGTDARIAAIINGAAASIPPAV